MLLQNLICHADADIITHNWIHNERIKEPKTRPFPDFKVIKQCRDFDGLLGWANEDGVRDLNRKWNDLRVPEGMQIMNEDGYA